MSTHNYLVINQYDTL